MEPRILLVGKLQSTLDVLTVELKRLGRQVISSNDIDRICEFLKNGEADFVVVGAGLSESHRKELISTMKECDPEIPIYLVERTADASPVKLLQLANEKAIMFKIHLAAGIKPVSKD